MKKKHQQNLLQLINNWLERIPFFEDEFWKNYKPLSNNNFDSMFFGMITERFIKMD